MIEIEKTYLAKEIPKDLHLAECLEINDLYIPSTYPHPILRIRKRGESYEITKKTQIDPHDFTRFREDTISLTKEEYLSLSKVEGKCIRRFRYNYPLFKLKAEIDFYQGELLGLVTVDVEFNSIKDKNNFQMPEFCLVEVTDQEFIASGMLAGKKYQDIEKFLKNYGYVKIYIKND